MKPDFKIKTDITVKPRKGFLRGIKVKDASLFTTKGYVRRNGDIFAIVKIESRQYGPFKWKIVHRPSATPFASFERKRDAEHLLKIFFTIIDEKEVRFYSPDFEILREEINHAYGVANTEVFKQKNGWTKVRPKVW